MPVRLDSVFETLEEAEIFAAIGTSGQVYPAAGLVELAHRLGVRCLELNLGETPTSPYFHKRITGPAAATLPKWVDSVLEGKQIRLPP